MNSRPQTPQRQSRLFCRYYDNGRHPKYVIGPVKQEDEWDQPRIVRYHDILSSREMAKVKELAKPRVRGKSRDICLSVLTDIASINTNGTDPINNANISLDRCLRTYGLFASGSMSCWY